MGNAWDYAFPFTPMGNAWDYAFPFTPMGNAWDYAFPFTPMGNAWEEESARDPPVPSEIPDEIIYVSIEDTGWEQHENPGLTG